MSQKTVLILGGGVGGQVMANILGAGMRGEQRAVLIDQQQTFNFSSSFLWLMVGQRRSQDIQKPLSALGKKGVEVRQAEVSKIDPAGRVVETSVGKLGFDYLILALGAELAPDKVPGFEEGALNLYTLEGAIQIQQTLATFQQGKVVILISASPFKCPAAPYEAAFLIEDFLRKRGRGTEVEVFTPEPFPMPAAGPAVGGALKGMLEASGIRVHTEHKVTSISPQARAITFANGAQANYDLLVGVPPHQAPQVVRDAGLVNEAGWVPADPKTLATQYEGIYALGDVAAVPIAGGKSLPKAGVFAHYQAEVVAKNILAQLAGRAAHRTYDGRGWCAIELGSGRAAFGDGNFYDAKGPQIKLHAPARRWHWGKALFEKWWLWRWF